MFVFCFLKRTQVSSTLFSSVSHSVVSDSMWPHGLRQHRLPCPKTTPRACSISWLDLMIRSWSSNLDPQTLLIFYSWKYVTFKNLSLFVLPSSFWQSFFYSDFFSFSFFETPYSWDHMVFLFLWLNLLNVMSSSFIHVATNGRISF